MSDAAPGHPVGPPVGSSSGTDEWFDRLFPRMVGVVHGVLDPDGRTDTSLASSEDLCTEAFSRTPRRGGDEERTTAVLRRCLDRCMDVMVGDELHHALSSMRAPDRHVGLLVHAGGWSPADTAVLLQRPLDEVLQRLARVATRLEDARRLGPLDMAERAS
jgi:hypothetical protein